MRDAGLKGEAERGIHGLSVLDGADGTAAAHVTGDELEVLAGPGFDLPRDITVGSAVVAETADAVLLVPLVRERIDAAGERNGGVERGFKAAHHQPVRQNAPEDPDGLNIGRIVRRGHGYALLHSGDDLIRKLMDTVIALSQHGLEADGLQLLDGAERAGVFTQQILQEEPDPRGVIRDGDPLQLLEEAVPVVAIGKDRVPAADTFGFRLHKDLSRWHVKELVLQGSAAHIADKDQHDDSPSGSVFILHFVASSAVSGCFQYIPSHQARQH